MTNKRDPGDSVVEEVTITPLSTTSRPKLNLRPLGRVIAELQDRGGFLLMFPDGSVMFLGDMKAVGSAVGAWASGQTADGEGTSHLLEWRNMNNASLADRRLAGFTL